MNITVVGLGYVGLPLSVRLVQIGHNVLGIDKNIDKIKKLQKGLLPLAKDEPDLEHLFIKSYRSGRISFSWQFEDIQNSEIIIVCVDTPVQNHTPNYASLLSALGSIGKQLRKNQIVIIESTIAPKTTKNIVIPTLEKGSNLKVNQDFYVAAVPERIRPGYIFKQLTSLSRVIGVSDIKVGPKLRKFYSQITSGDLDVVDVTTAEAVKTVENAYRDVQIAFANEIAQACEILNINVNIVRGLVNKSPYRDMHKPGPGVGGHCIPKDPWLLASSVYPTRLNLIETARRVNDSMPMHVYKLINYALKISKLKTPRITILGYSYIENSDDTRNSPTEGLVKILDKMKLKYTIHDPNIEKYNKKQAIDHLTGSDCLVLMVGHNEYKKLSPRKLKSVMKSSIIIDGKSFFRQEEMEKLNFFYLAIGNV